MHFVTADCIPAYRAIFRIYLNAVVFICIKEKAALQEGADTAGWFHNCRRVYVTALFQVDTDLFCKVSRGLVIAIFLFAAHYAPLHRLWPLQAAV